MQFPRVGRWFQNDSRQTFGRSYYILGQDGWQEVADFALEWGESRPGWNSGPEERLTLLFNADLLRLPLLWGLKCTAVVRPEA